MLKFILRRLLYGCIVMLGAVLVVFVIFNVMPGNPVDMLAGQRTDVSTRAAITKELGLDQPLIKQLALYLSDLSPVSLHNNTKNNQDKYNYFSIYSWGEKVLVIKFPYLRRSFQNNKKVSTILLDHLEGTLWLAFAAMLFATVFGVLFGIAAALKQNTFLDKLLVTLTVVGLSAPPFVVGAIMAMVFGFYLSEYTGLNASGHLWEYELNGKVLTLKNLILPAITLGLRPLAIITQFTRGSMLEVLGQDYIRTAHAKGLNMFTIVMRHALLNALNPVITAVSGWLASLMAGAFFIEKVFNWKGLGSVTINAVYNLDFPVVMGSTLFVAFIFIIINILVDVLYAAIDPRVVIKS